MKILPLVMKKLSEIRVFVLSMKDTNKHPVGVPRVQLDGFLRMTQTELLEVFGVNSPNKLTLTLRKAVTVVSRIHKGSDSYRVIGEKVGVLIKRLRPLYVDQLERDTKRRSERMALVKRFSILSGGRTLPDGVHNEQILQLIVELRIGLEAVVVKLQSKLNEPTRHHPNIGAIGDEKLFAIAKKLDKRVAEQPRTFKEKFLHNEAMKKPSRAQSQLLH